MSRSGSFLQLTVHLLRHGDVVETRRQKGVPYDPSLSEAGREQIRQAMRQLILPTLRVDRGDLVIRRIFHSGLLRAHQSALEVADEIELARPQIVRAAALDYRPKLDRVPENRQEFMELMGEVVERDNLTMGWWHRHWSLALLTRCELLAWMQQLVLVEFRHLEPGHHYHIIGVGHHPFIAMAMDQIMEVPANWPHASLVSYTWGFEHANGPPTLRHASLCSL